MISILIFSKKCRYIDNRYGLSIYRTPLLDDHMMKKLTWQAGDEQWPGIVGPQAAWSCPPRSRSQDRRRRKAGSDGRPSPPTPWVGKMRPTTDNTRYLGILLLRELFNFSISSHKRESTSAWVQAALPSTSNGIHTLLPIWVLFGSWNQLLVSCQEMIHHYLNKEGSQHWSQLLLNQWQRKPWWCLTRSHRSGLSELVCATPPLVPGTKIMERATQEDNTIVPRSFKAICWFTWMDGWMNGWMDEWLNGWMDGWCDSPVPSIS